MPLNMIGNGSTAEIKRVSGSEDVRRYLANLGFVPGTKVTLVQEIEGNIIVSVYDSRVAINKDMATHILV